MFDIQDKVFLITGAAGGIGAGVTRAVLDKGAKKVAVLDVNETQGKALENELNDKHGADRVKFIKCDITGFELDSAYDETLKQFGYIDVVINNAGIMNDSPNVYEKEIAVNVNALIKSSLKAYNLMRKDRNGNGGTIVNISSIVGLIQSPLLPVYSATKSAVLQFSNCLGMETNYRRSDVRVLTICFGTTDTNLISGRVGCIDEDNEELLIVALQKLPAQERARQAHGKRRLANAMHTINVNSAVSGLVTVLENGASGSTWLVTSKRPAEDITGNVRKSYEILSQGVFE